MSLIMAGSWMAKNKCALPCGSVQFVVVVLLLKNSGGSGARWNKQKSDLEVSFYRPWLTTRMMSSCLLWLQRRKNREKFQDWSTRLAVSSNEASWCARESMTMAKKWFLAEETVMFFFQNPRQEQRRRKHEVHIFTGPCFPIILCTLFWALQVGPKQVLNLICGSILVFFKTQIQTNALPKHFLLHILCNISSSVTGWNVDHCFLSKSWFVFSFEHYGVLIWLIVA